jgi:hypothetical protein
MKVLAGRTPKKGDAKLQELLKLFSTMRSEEFLAPFGAYRCVFAFLN